MNTAPARIRALAIFPVLLGLTACDDSLFGVTEAIGSPPATDLMTLRWELLACAKARLTAADDSLRPALERLIDAAQAALAEPPVSVTDKRYVTPSGDGHDYVSLAAQFWPDPNQPDGLPYIPRPGFRNPEADDDDKYDQRRLQLLINCVRALTLAYYFTGRIEFAQHAAAYVRTWFVDPATRMNPHLEYANFTPGVRTGSANGIIEMRRLPRVLDVLGLLRAGGHWKTDDQRAMNEWLSAYFDWLWSSPRGQSESRMQNNHGTWYDVQAAGIALFLGRASFARNVLASSAMQRIAAQIEPEGSQPLALRRIHSFFYHIFNLRALMQLAGMGRRVDVDLWHYTAPNGGSIRAALDYLAPYADPANQWPKPGANPPPPGNMLGLLRRGELVYGDSSYAAWIARIPEDATRDHRAQLLYPSRCGGGRDALPLQGLQASQ